MAFYQNLFNDYIGNYVVGDSRAFTLSFRVPQNRNHGEFFICWNTGPYNLSGLTNLTLNYAYDQNFENWNSLTVDFGMVGILSASEIVDILNSDTTFTQFYTASVYKNTQVGIRQKKPASEFRTYISNTSAERVLGFNKFAGYADMPTYFDKDTIDNRFKYPEANNQLIRLGKSIVGNTVANPTVVTCIGHGLHTGDTIFITNSNSTPSIDGLQTITVSDDNTFSVPVDVTIAGNTGDVFTEDEVIALSSAGFNYQDVKQDYEHLGGRCGAFLCTKNTVDGSDRITNQIIYQTGATAGMLGTKICYSYTNTNKTPDTIFSQPIVLTDDDLLMPCKEPELS